MIEFTLKLADVPAGVICRYPSTKEYCSRFLTAEQPVFTVSVEEADYRFEQQTLGDQKYSDAYLELLAVYRKLCEGLVPFGIFLLHGSAVAVDGEAYIFIALSGTGKSTHTALWRRVLSEEHEVVMVNDDKPLIRVNPDGTATVYGTPWDGKHHLSTNIAVPLKAICILERAEQNTIRQITAGEAYSMLLQQAYRPMDSMALSKTLTLIDRLTASVSLWRLGCNTDIEAARVAYETMKG